MRQPALAAQRVILATAIAAALAGASASARAARDFTELTLEELLDTRIVSASKYAQKSSESAAAVTVITHDEIRQFGWRTLAEVLRSVRGFYVHGDRDYEYAGVRGFARPQDYNSRLLLLIDGHRSNDVLYDQAYVGTDAILDLDLVDRIEIVRGPGSSLYGGNAMFGVVNLITRTATQIAGAELAARYSSFNTREGRATLGKRFDNGAELVASVYGMASAGPSLYLPEFDSPETHFGRTSGTDYDRNARAYLRWSQDALVLTAAASRRNQGVPTGVDGSRFNDPTNANADTQMFADLAYSRPVGNDTEASARLFWAEYLSRSPSNFGEPPVLNHDDGRAAWWGADLKLVSRWSRQHVLVAGVEVQDNYRQDQYSYDADPYQSYLDAKTRGRRVGVFVQDDFQWTESMKISLGARYDKVTGQPGEVSPRVGIVYRSDENTVWKFQYGSTFRAPNVYESNYLFPGTQIANPSLVSEKMVTYEGGVEHFVGRQTRLLATLYSYRLDRLIDQVVESESGLLQYQNAGDSSARGVEFEFEHQWDNGARLRGSLDLQQARDAHGATLTNSPRAVAKFSASAPLPWASLRLGVEGQWLSSRETELGRVPSYGVVNVTLLRPRQSDGWEFSLSAFNLFDRRYADPSAFDPAVPARDRIEQDGRTLRIKAVYRF